MIEWFIFSLPMWLLSICCIVKATLYLTYKSKKDKLRYVLYYPHMQIACTTNGKKSIIKILQNRLSIAAVLIAIVYIALIIAVGERNEPNLNESIAPTTLQNGL